jgi:adenylate cyclase
VTYSAEEAAHRAGVAADYFQTLVELGLVQPDASGAFSPVDARRAACIQAINQAGISLESLAAGLERGATQLDFLDQPVYERFAATSDETFAALSDRTGIPFGLLSAIRESLGSAPPDPRDYVRAYELVMVPFVEVARRAGYTEASVESLLRVTGDALRRVAETEASLFYQDILGPQVAAGTGALELNSEIADRLSAETDNYIRAIYHGQQAHAWLINVVEAIGRQLAAVGLHERVERPPAICFLDITGYTRLTQEHGDAAAADLAERLGRIVQRSSTGRGGRPVKWLGDGVMFYFDTPGPAVQAAIDMVAAVSEAELPPAHVGVASGEVLFQQGDYYGQTVNRAARIADFARPREVLVDQAVVDASAEPDLAFEDIGPVELKGVSEPVRLYAAQRTTPSA